MSTLNQSAPLRFITAGSVDDGKSTLIGRLLYDSKTLLSDQIQKLNQTRTPSEAIDFSALTDGLEAEREQGITIDVAYRYFATPTRKFIIADTPGHEQYTRNMVTGASTAHAAVVLIDASQLDFMQAPLQLLPQTKRHAAILKHLRCPHVLVAVNKMDHLGTETILKRLPSVHEIGLHFANVDITREPVPVVPTIHYMMGGIPTNINGQVVEHIDGANRIVNGLYAVGECACVSVHGANRLGTNSLLDLLVFGKAAGDHIVGSGLREQSHKPLPADAADKTRERLARLDASTDGEYSQVIAADMRKAMQQHAGVFRTQALMDEGVEKIAAIRERVSSARPGPRP